MKPYLLVVLVMLVAVSQPPVYAQSEECLPPRFLGGQMVRVTGSVDAGGLPFRDQPSLSEPVNGIIPLDAVVSSQDMLPCAEGRNWYTVFYAPSAEDEPEEVWVMDGDGATYWLERVPVCGSDQHGASLLTYSPDIRGLLVDGFDPQTHILRFSLDIRQKEDDPPLKHRYFNFEVITGMLTEVDYWYRDIITREFTDRVGITEQVFGEGEDFSTVYVSPDKTQVLYRVTNPMIPDCAHGCVTETLWIANRDGSNPIALSEFYGYITRIIWDEDNRIHLSLTPLEVWEPDFSLTVCADGSCAAYDEELILDDRSLPFDQIWHMPTFSPNGEWIATTVGSDALSADGIFRLAVILNRRDGRYIRLPYNGEAAVSIPWLDDDTILYPMANIVPDDAQDGRRFLFDGDVTLSALNLDFANLTYTPAGKQTEWNNTVRTDPMFNSEQTHHIIDFGSGVIIYSISRQVLDIYCYAYG